MASIEVIIRDDEGNTKSQVATRKSQVKNEPSRAL